MTFAERIGRLDAANDHAPLYRQLQRALREAIQKKILSPDDALPAERDLADEFKISRITVRKALDGLVGEGLLTRRQGAGTFVARDVPRLPRASAECHTPDDAAPRSLPLTVGVTAPDPRTSRIFRRLMTAIGRPDLAEDESLARNAARWDRRDELDEAIAAWTRTLPRDEALDVLDDAGVPAGPILTAADTAASRVYQRVGFHIIGTGMAFIDEGSGETRSQESGVRSQGNGGTLPPLSAPERGRG